MPRVAVCPIAFSRNPILRAELLARFPEATFNDAGRNLVGTELIDFLRGHDLAVIALERLDATVFEAVPELRVVAKVGVGLDMIDLDAMARHGVRLGWTAGVNKRSVAELTLGFMLALLRNLSRSDRDMRAGGTWNRIQGRELSGRVVGIVGCGNVGREVVRLLRPFGCRVLVHDVRDDAEFYAAHGIEPVDLETLLVESEIVTLHVPRDETTFDMISAERMDLMRRDAILINTARGGIVDEEALKIALREGKIAAAAIDTFEAEPPRDRELLALPNLMSTPHIGSTTPEAILAMGRAAIAGLSDNRPPGPDWPLPPHPDRTGRRR